MAERPEIKQYVVMERTYKSGSVKEVWSSRLEKSNPPRRHSLKTDRLFAVIEGDDRILRKIPLNENNQFLIEESEND